jgi:nicotinamide-nucleotide amidase
VADPGLDCIAGGSAPLGTAEIVAVGSELLTAFRLDTNSLFLTGRLNGLGIEVRRKTVVGDDRAGIRDALEGALARTDLVILTGGLGPTDDDLTREVVAEALGLALEEDATVTEGIRRRFAARQLVMPENNRRQAMVPRGAVVLENVNGTAPGLLIERGRKMILLLPGPPGELQPMADALVAGPLGSRAGRRRLARRVLRVTGRTESHVEQAVQPIYSRWRAWHPPIETTILAAPGQIELHLTAGAEDEIAAGGVLEVATAELAAVLGADLFSTDGRTLEEVVGNLCRARGLSLAVGESCTGGLVASRLTDVPGSSAFFIFGVVAYSNESKTAALGVPAETIQLHGAVSKPVAVALAEGARRRGRADVGVGVTGIAGPGGGSAHKPVGTVVIAVAGPANGLSVRSYSFPGGRSQVKHQASQGALDLVRRALLDSDDAIAPARVPHAHAPSRHDPPE